MSLFQNSVINKYVKGLDKAKVDEAWDRFITHFHNRTIQENIRNSKEEQYQGEFLIDLFVNVLGYVKNPTPDFNLTTELKNVKGAKKTDGAILKDEKALAVIELKGTNTTDLGKVETQAFGYKNNQPGCVYVITSNFEKLRFYIDNAVDFEEFNLFQLTRERFEMLWICLSAEYLLKNIPKQIKDESLTQEEAITKKLYKDYSLFRNEIFDSIQKNNPEYDKLTLFKKTQKLLDRFLFIFFAEDRLLLPPNSIREIINQWTTLRDDLDAYVPLYNRFRKYFGYLNTGYKGQKYEIFAYNGGLFLPDEILDNIKIDDELLYKHTLNLSNYDFESEVSVNILGHIFEHSLTEIENIQSELHSNGFKPIGKRKKDGVFYTPKYITKYIVEHTVGKLCEEKKTKLDIQEAEYEKERKGRKKTVLKTLNKKLEDYRKWLLEITICDPACGSGAFLNQALEFLIKEHGYIDELQAKLLGATIVLSDIENSILENNLFGVDINEESVEIAKLSLWLRTAQKGRKLTSLNNNIKCGNSLIDDPEVAGDKAFKWENEFPAVFIPKDKQAFHVVLTTHNSRTSQRMIKYNVQKGLPVELKLEEEIELTKIIGQIIQEKGYQCIAYNICKDHVHLILVCEYEELTEVVKTLKGKSAYMYQFNGFKPIGESLWSQKFFRADLDVWKLASLSNTPGYLYKSSHLENAIPYIINNREKHQLLASQKLKKIIAGFVVSQEEAFALGYKGGFDVVIGNPPYVRAELFGEFRFYLENTYSVYNPSGDLFSYFYEKSFNLLKKKTGVFGFISNTFDKTTAGITIREYLSGQVSFLKYIDFTEVQIFEGATTYPVVIIAQNKKKIKNEFQYIKIPKESQAIIIDIDFHESIDVEQSILDKKSWSFKSKFAVKFIEKLNKNRTIRNVYGKTNRGIVTGFNEAFIVDLSFKNVVKKQSGSDSKLIPKLLEGKDLAKWHIPPNDKHIIFSRRGIDIDQYPIIKTHLEKYRLDLEPRNSKEQIRGRKPGKYKWFEIQDSVDYYQNFEKPKIVFPNLQNKNKFSFDETGAYINAPAVILPTNDKFLTAILNSKVVWYFLTNICVVRSGGYIEVKPQYFEQIPIPVVSGLLKSNLDIAAKEAILKTSELQKVILSLIDLLQAKFPPTDVSMGLNPLGMSRKLQNWHELLFGDFLKELKKKKVKLSLSEEAEWMKYFNEQKDKAQSIQAEIEKIDKAIDKMVYELYGLTAEEIKIVEQS